MTSTPSSSSSTPTPTSTAPPTFNPLSYSSASHPRASNGNGHDNGNGDTPQQPAHSQTRLYVGNLHPSTTEYDLVQLLSPHGKLAKLDMVFHKVGPLRGQPRGYAFVEYVRGEDARAAQVHLSGGGGGGGGAGVELRGRKISVGFAKLTDYAASAAGGQSSTGPMRRGGSRGSDDAFKPTTLSLVKNSQRPQGTDAKIAAMDAKLRALKAAKSRGSDASSGSGAHPRSSAAATNGSRSTTTTTTNLRAVPSAAGLPPRPKSTGVRDRG